MDCQEGHGSVSSYSEVVAAMVCLLLRGGEKGWEREEESKAVAEIGPKCSSCDFFYACMFQGRL